MSIEVIVLVVVVASVVGLVWYLRSFQQKMQSSLSEKIITESLKQLTGTVSEQAKQILGQERELISKDLTTKHYLLERMVKDLKLDLEQRHSELRQADKERHKQFGAMATALEQHRELTSELKVSTDQLSKVLANNQQRGAWGERIIEDLLQANGLLEGVHYQKQTTLAGSSLRPDISLLLPNERVVAVDVKFPYSEMQKMAAAETKSAKAGHLKQFVVDLKAKIAQVAKYIDPDHATLDYAILFVPNEAIFSYINQQLPEIVDEAMAKRVIIVSPFTFLIVARTVLESYRNFMMSDRLREVITYVDEFVGEWDKFKEGFEKYGRSIATLQSDYEKLTGTRVRQMEKKLERIDSIRSGELLEEVASAKQD